MFFNYIRENGMMFGMDDNPMMVTTVNENGREIMFSVDTESSLDLFNANINDLFNEFDCSQLKFGLRVMNHHMVKEATNLKLPVNAEKDLKNLNYYERLEKIDKINHVNIWIEPQLKEHDRYSDCWIFVELPKEIEDVKYAPIIVHKGGGVSVHPYAHKYFLRSFDKRTRHLILGFCYIYGPMIAGIGNMRAEKGKDFTDSDIFEFNMNALSYKDSDAPKRINLGPTDNSSYFKPSTDDYNRWVKSLKSI